MGSFVPQADPVSAFLHFGYLPRMGTRLLEKVAEASKAAPETDTSAQNLIRRGARALRRGVENAGPGTHVVPLSGGLDSRALLGCLLEQELTGNIVTVTFGVPGAFDYEIARRVAHHAGVAHEAIDLNRIPLDEDAFRSALTTSGACSWGFDVLFHRLIPERFGHDATYWSGFMASSGKRLPPQRAVSWPAAITAFAQSNRFCRTIALARPGFDPQPLLPAQPPLAEELLAYHDQLDFGVRQEGYIGPTVVPRGYDYRTPYLHPDWMSFIRGLPFELRGGGKLYRELLRSEFPDLFKLPSKNTLGLPLGAPNWLVTARRRSAKAAAALRGRRFTHILRRPFPHPRQMTNYLDFGESLRSRDDLRTLVHDAVHALDRRGVAPWLQPAELWHQQQGAPRDEELARAVILLASLELNLRLDEERPRPLLVSADAPRTFFASAP